MLLCVCNAKINTCCVQVITCYVDNFNKSMLYLNAVIHVTCIFSAPPGPPNVTAQTIGPDMVQVVMSPSPNGGLPTSYNATISNSSYTNSPAIMASGSAMVNFNGLRIGSTYNISVVAINCAGNNSTQSYISVISCKYTGLV